jgi:hypothetical protein
MDFASVAWWAYGLAVLAGAGFGVLQSMLMKRALLGDNPQKGLYAVKFILWAAALVVAALISIPLLLAFVVAASVTLVFVSLRIYKKTQKGAR